MCTNASTFIIRFDCCISDIEVLFPIGRIAISCARGFGVERARANGVGNFSRTGGLPFFVTGLLLCYASDSSSKWHP